MARGGGGTRKTFFSATKPSQLCARCLCLPGGAGRAPQLVRRQQQERER